MRGLFKSYSIVLACSALGAGDMGIATDPNFPLPSRSPPNAIAEIERSSIGAAATQRCLSEAGMCEYGCDLDYAAGAAACALHGFTAQAAICHATNSGVYGACLAGCRYQ
jgi:hypothetical protein